MATSRRPFLRRTKATAPPDTTAPLPDTIAPIETTTSKYTRRGNSRFKSRNGEKKTKDAGAKNDSSTEATPSLRTTARVERPRKYVRRRLGGANSTTSTPTVSSSTTTVPLASSSRRPFRVANRRRPVSTTRGTTTAATKPSSSATTTEATTTTIDESLQDISGLDFQSPTDITSAEITSAEQERLSTSKSKKTIKVQRRPLTSLKTDVTDQNPSATNEDESKRQSKKYSASIKQNQLDEVLKQKKSQEVTTEALIDEYNAETAIAIAAHQLMSAPPPSISDYDDQSEKSTNRSPTPPRTTFEYSFTSPGYKSRLFSDEVNQVYQSTIAPAYLPTSPRTYIGQSPSGFTKTSTLTSTEFSSSPKSVLTQSSPVLSQFTPSLGPSTARYLGINENKFLGVPVEDIGYSTSGYTGIAQEPSYFTREYLLESPVTKTYDDEYQYLSPTTPVPTTPKATQKSIYRKISTTLRPTTPTFIPISTTIKPRRVPNKKPFEKVAKDVPNRTYRPVENYDYYDDSDEKFVQKYEEGTQVVLHGKGTIECLDVGNFPHPSSCKKFISCARMESGAILGWEYICPKGLSFDPVGGMCNWSAGLGCDEKGL